MATAHADFESVTEARKSFRAVLDMADRGRAVTINRNNTVSAVVPAGKLRAFFAATVPSRASVFAEDDRWVVLMEGRPFVSEGDTLDAAVADLVVSLREYAADWDARLRLAPNHEDNWALVQLVNLSSDEELTSWIEQEGE